MKNTKFNIGDILKVSRKKHPNEYWYEKVYQVQPEIITEDMPEEKYADISRQGLTENFNYEVVETFKISSALIAQIVSCQHSWHYDGAKNNVETWKCCKCDEVYVGKLPAKMLQ